MKRKILLSTVAFLLIITSMILMQTKVSAAEMSDEFKSYLNSDGKLVLNAAPPKDDFELDMIMEQSFNNYDENGNWLGYGWESQPDLKSVKFKINCHTDNPEEHIVEVIFNYDKDIKTMVDGYLSKIPAGKNEFEVRDLEFINFWVNGEGNSKYITYYSGELKQYYDYKNFQLDVRGGGPAPFSTGSVGMGVLRYDDIIYGIKPVISISGDHIIYVPDTTADTSEAMLEAAQKRIADYVGTEKAELTLVATAWDYWVEYLYTEKKDEWMLDDSDMTIEEFEQVITNYYTPEYYDTFEDGFRYELGISGINEEDLICELNVFFDENMGDAFNLIVRKDSSKMLTPSYITSDVSTNITIASDNTSIPLDTMVKVQELTSGTIYDRIVKELHLTDNVTFDLKLHAGSIEQNITQLDNGNFEVKIPIPEDLKDKDLEVYCVGESGEPEKFKAEFKDGYAVFTTNHFSVYTLGSKTVATEEKEKDEVPKTGIIDLTNYAISIVMMSALGLVLVNKKK